MRKAFGALLASLVLAALWSLAWFAASRAAARQVDGFIAAEARLGRDWVCPDRRIEGFPFAMSVSCSDAAYAGQASGQRVEGQVAGLTASVSLWHPLSVVVALTPPFSFRSSDGQTQVGGGWDALSLSFSSLPDPRQMVLAGTNVDVHGRFPGSNEAGGHAATVAARFTASPPQPDPTLDLDLAMTGAPAQIVDGLLGDGSVPIDMTFVGRLDKIDVGGAKTPEQAMERWRAAGGSIAVSNLVVRRGGASVTAAGALGLDALHRVRGRLDASFVGLEPILARFGISGNVAALGSLIGTFFGGGHPAKAATPGALTLPISFGNGRLGIGPITTDVKLQPLY